MNHNDYWNNDAFCPMPWGAIYVDPAGSVDHCCISSNYLGNVNKHTVETIVGNKKNITIKSEMLAGKKSTGCYKCYSPDGSPGADYLRNSQLREFETWLPDFSIYDNPENFQLQYADLRMRNTCNYACVYCGPGFSSTWASELGQFVNTNNTSIDSVLEFFYNNITTIKKVYLAGGEPLLIKENEQLLERLLEVNPDCSLLVNTNLSVIKGNRIFDLITKFNNVQWLVSVDDIEQRYNYIRHPGDWNVFSNNLDILNRTTPKKHHIFFNMVYTALNAKSIFNCIRFLLKSGYAKNPGFINLAYVNGGQVPTWLDPRALPKLYLDQVRLILDNYPKTGFARFDTGLEHLKLSLNTPVNIPSGRNLFDELDKLDQRRNLDSKSVFSDIYASRQ